MCAGCVDPTAPASNMPASSAPFSTTMPPSIAPPSIDGLAVAAEGSDSGYDRALFQPQAWADLDGDGCDTRAEVLIRDSRSLAEVQPGCSVARGDWLSIYDGYSTPDPGELDIDHVVALAEAWRSGADGWPNERRLAFAQDEDNLIAVTAATNRSKSDRDPAVWQPPNRDSWCAFAQRWTSAKVRWGLTADPAEVNAVRVMLGTC